MNLIFEIIGHCVEGPVFLTFSLYNLCGNFIAIYFRQDSCLKIRPNLIGGLLYRFLLPVSPTASVISWLYHHQK